jgi:hypothetical protein
VDSTGFRPLGPSACSALSSTGSSEASSPGSSVLRRCATPCAPLAALRCLRLAIPCGVPVVSLPAVQDTKPRAWGSQSGPHFRKFPQGAWSNRGHSGIFFAKRNLCDLESAHAQKKANRVRAASSLPRDAVSKRRG